MPRTSSLLEAVVQRVGTLWYSDQKPSADAPNLTRPDLAPVRTNVGSEARAPEKGRHVLQSTVIQVAVICQGGA
jgi:hypothetical protein